MIKPKVHNPPENPALYSFDNEQIGESITQKESYIWKTPMLVFHRGNDYRVTLKCIFMTTKKDSLGFFLKNH